MFVLVVGYQKSGRSASKLLKSLGYKVVVVSDDRALSQEQIDRLLVNLSFIVVSPGVLPNSPLLVAAHKNNIKVISELELGFQNTKGRVVAITGTNGKTTTTKLTAHLLGEDNVFVAGNLGVPLCDVCKKTNDQSTVVCEVSSFQLMHTNLFKPKIAAFLNLTPDHQNYHFTMQNYLNAKLNVFKEQTQQDYAVLNYDDKVAKNSRVSKARIYFFSTKKRVNGCFASGGNIYFRDTTKHLKGFEKSVLIAKVTDVKLLGEHNLSNAVCAICCAILSGENPENIRTRLQTFKPVKHRLEFVTDINSVSFINDSKATNTDSTICAINSMTQPTTLILGGSDKGCDFDCLFCKTSLISNYVFMGETKHKLARAAQKHGKTNYVFADSLSEAVLLAYQMSERGNTVLFSPACASFDMFANFEERGKCFCGVVRGLKRSENNNNKNHKKEIF